MAVIDAITRRLPGALSSAESVEKDSFAEALDRGLEHPHYTRPSSYRGWEVPEVLRSGDHGRVERWRRGKTRFLRRISEALEKKTNEYLLESRVIASIERTIRAASLARSRTSPLTDSRTPASAT